MAPEVCGSRRQFHGKMTDIWAAGITLYYLTSGRIPFIAKKIEDLYTVIRTQEVKFPNKMSASLKDLLRGMLIKDPEERFSISRVMVHEWIVTNKN